jgi:hypothetical protein
VPNENSPPDPRTSAGRLRCFGCGQPLPYRHRRLEAQLCADGQLYCLGTTCEADASEARSRKRARGGPHEDLL